MDKENIRQFAHDLGADVIGFANIEDYQSERSPDPKTIMPNVESIIVLGYRELNGAVESKNARISMTARMGGMEVSLKDSYLLSRYVEDKFNVRAAPIAFSYPLDMAGEGMGLVGDVSLRHAAVAAGLGVFGRHNLVINPKFGTRIIFSAVLTEMPMVSDAPVEEDYCRDCDLCVRACPANALDEEGKTDMMKCLGVSQPYGIGEMMRYARRFIGASPDEQKAVLKDPLFMSLYQTAFIGFQYSCFRCMRVCPVCVEP